jgi:hypothetical protein
VSLPLTPIILRGAYEFLLCTPPFRSLKLPGAEWVQFRVTRHRDQEGDHFVKDGLKHVLRVSSRTIGHTQSLLMVMGHEMLHVHQEVEGVRSHHNPEFCRLAHRVCRYHGWDPKVFIGPI